MIQDWVGRLCPIDVEEFARGTIIVLPIAHLHAQDECAKMLDWSARVSWADSVHECLNK